MHLIPDDIYDFYFVNKDIEAQRGKREVPNILQAGSGADTGVWIQGLFLPLVGAVGPVRPLLGSSPGMPAMGLLNYQAL